MKYNYKFFRDGLPDWKKKRDPIVVRLFYRPLSFYCSAFFSNLGITANDVTVISIIVAVVVGVLFFCAGTKKAIGIIAAIMISVWLLLDCSDGNMARCVRKQPYGEFLDALGIYVLVASLGIGLSRYLYLNGGLIFGPRSIAVVFIGLSSPIFDLLMRVTHQKTVATDLKYDFHNAIIGSDEGNSRGFLSKAKDRIQLELGLGGILAPVFIICTIFNILDLVAIYLLIYNGLSCMFIVILYIFKAMKLRNRDF